MKTTAKVFIWIGMIANFYLVFPIFIGLHALEKLEKAKSKDELKTTAWLTFWFCNMIGGFCMLRLNECDLTTSNKPTISNTRYIINTNEIKIKNSQLYDTKEFKVVLFIMLLSLVLSSVSLFFGSILHYLDNVAFSIDHLKFIPIIISSIIEGLIIALLILTLPNKFNLSKPTKILLYIVSVMLIFIFITSLIDSFCYEAYLYSYKCDDHSYLYVARYFGENYIPNANCELISYKKHRNSIVYPILATIISAILIAAATMLLIKNHKIKKPIIAEKIKVVKEKVTISSIEYEINNIKNLMDNGVIDEEEYKTLRKGIIEKYSKN